ncbi:MAG: adenosine deaminase, partial [Lachnospiraceae bacterium]|nr:adenosine deaminase [Lachnospiraceae bacterium]
MDSFIDALQQRNLEKIRAFPKSDLHNHFVLGGSRQYLRGMTGIRIEPVKSPLSSMEEMHAWNRENLGERFNSPEMRKLLIRAAFYQAKEDGVTVLEIGAV